MIEKKLIGKAELVRIVGHDTTARVPAKVDTGADSSSIWATNIKIDEAGQLSFTLFGSDSEFYTGEVIHRQDYKVAQVASSSGHTQIRYRTHLTLKIKGKKIKALFNLSDRSNNKFPILIGRRTIAGKFLVDVNRGLKKEKRFDNSTLNDELKRDPYSFFRKYHK